MTSKLYPFSVQKHAHDIEFRCNRVFCEMHDMEVGETPYEARKYARMSDMRDELDDLLMAVLNSRDGRIAYLTGKQIGLAKETVIWADSERSNRNEGRNNCFA